MEAQDFDRTRGQAIGASDRAMVKTQRDIILSLEARVAELEAGIEAHRKERLPHMTNAHDRALWSLVAVPESLGLRQGCIPDPGWSFGPSFHQADS